MRETWFRSEDKERMMSAEYTGERFLPKACKGEMEIEHYQRYRFAAAFVKGKKVLDAACGEGYGSHILSWTQPAGKGMEAIFFQRRQKR